MVLLAALGIVGLFFFISGSEDAQAEESETVGTPVNQNWRKFDQIFSYYASAFGVPFNWLKAIAMNESSLGTYPSVARGIASPTDVAGSKSQDGLSWGIMQVTIKTARSLDPTATEVKLNDPNYSVRLAAQYLAQLSTKYSKLDNRYMEWVIKSYNQGPGNTNKERNGQTSGYANEYWARFQRNLKTIEENP